MSFGKKIIEKMITDKNSEISKKKYLAVIVALCLIIVATLTLGIVTAVSWLNPSTGATLNVSVSDYKAEMCVGDINTPLTSNRSYSEDDLEDLNLVVKFSSKGSSAYIRVKMFESFIDSNGGLIATKSVTYAYDQTNWVLYDGYYYYKNSITGGSDSISIPFSTGCELSESIDSSDRVKLVAQVESVQVDRAQEFFGYVPTAQ